MMEMVTMMMKQMKDPINNLVFWAADLSHQGSL